MTTLKKKLEESAQVHGKPVPYGPHVNLISNAIIRRLTAAGLYNNIKKVREIIMVNNYPKAAYPIMEEVIEQYFSGGLKKLEVKKPEKFKYANYDVPAHKAEAFDNALKLCGIEIQKNKESHGKVQYRIPVLIPSQLIGLGKAFQKERYNQEYRQRQSRRASTQRASIQNDIQKSSSTLNK